MRWEGDRLVPGRQVLPGRLANLMGLAYGDITHTGTSVVAAYSNQDRIRIYNGNGDKTWEAGERSGGDMLFFNLPKTSAGQPNKQFFPLRIRITDIDRDGKVELMIAHHDELANSMLASFRNFKNAKINICGVGRSRPGAQVGNPAALGPDQRLRRRRRGQ